MVYSAEKTLHAIEADPQTKAICDAYTAGVNAYISSLKEKDYPTHNFLQWYVNEQLEEERLARECNDKLEMIGDDKSGLYLFDRDIVMMGGAGHGHGKKKKH